MAVAAGPHAWVDDADGELEGGQSMMRVTVDVPFPLKSMAEAQLDISPNLLRLQGPQGASQEVQVLLPAGFECDPDSASAKFSKKKCQLTVISPNRAAPAVEVWPAQAMFSESADNVWPSSESCNGYPDVGSTRAPVAVTPAGSPSPAAAAPASQRATPSDDDDDDDDIPSLEGARRAPAAPASTNSPHMPAEAVAAWAAEGGAEQLTDEGNEAADDLMQRALAAKEKKRKDTEAARKSADLSSGAGLKKGFLSSGSSKSKKSTAKNGSKATATTVVSTQKRDVEDITYIGGCADPEAARKQSLLMPEVQQAVKQDAKQAVKQANKLKEDTSWVTPQLMTALQARPDLLKGLSNPKVQEAMALMQTDPAGAQKKYASDPDVAKFLMEFSQLMATHFDVLSKDPTQASGDPKQGSTSASPAPVIQMIGTPDKRPAVAEKAQEFLVMEDPAVQEAFRDPEVQNLLAELRAGRQLEFHELARSNPRLLQRIKLLLDKGLLSFQH